LSKSLSTAADGAATALASELSCSLKKGERFEIQSVNKPVAAADADADALLDDVLSVA
jgi:hypothetical protein